MINPAFVFLIALAVTVLNAFTARAIASIFVPQDKTSVAGFAFSIGSVGAYSHGVNDGGWAQLSMATGAVLGLAAVWYLFFKRETARGR